MDVVAHCLPGCYPLSPFIAAVSKMHRLFDHHMRAKFRGQCRGDLDPQAAFRIDADRLVAPDLARLAVGGDEHPGRIPLLSPLQLSQVGVNKIVALAPEAFAANHNRGATRCQCLLRGVQTLPQYSESACLGEPLRLAAITPPHTTPASRRDTSMIQLCGAAFTGVQRAPLRQHAHRRFKVRDMGYQTPHPQLKLVLHGPGNRPGPSRRGHSGDCALTPGPPSRSGSTI